MEDRFFSRRHEWVQKDEQGKVKVGISSCVQEELGEVVYVEFVSLGTLCSKDDCIGVVESSKAATDLQTPVAGRVVCVNERLVEQPTLINEAPEGAGWLCILDEVEEEWWKSLMTREGYLEYVQKGS